MRPSIRNTSRRPRIVALEDRIVPALIRWDGGPTGNGTDWLSATNWADNFNNDVLPGVNDDVIVSGTGSNPQIVLGASTAVRSATVNRALRITAGALSVATNVNTFAGLTLDGGTLDPANNTTITGTFAGPGAFTVPAGRTIIANGVTFNGPLVNNGTLIARGTVALNNGGTLAAGSTLQVQGFDNSGNALLNVSANITNNGALQLTSSGAANSASLSINGGPTTFTNAAGGVVEALAGVGGSRTITSSGQMVNQGTVTAATNLTVSVATHTTSGTVTIQPGVTLAQFGNFNYQGGTLAGGGTLFLDAITNIAAGQTLTNGPVSIVVAPQFPLFSGAINGPGTLANAVGGILELRGATVAAPFTNAGTVNFRTNNTVNGGLTTTATAITRVLGDSAFGAGGLTIGAGVVTNSGTFELTSTGPTANNASLSGTITNAAGATFASLVGSGGGRSINGTVVNQGTTNVAADLTFSSSTFNSSGTLTIQPGATMSLFSTIFNYQAGTVGGGGTLLSNTRINIAAGLTLTNGPTLTVQQFGGEINGPGTMANAAGATFEPQAVTFNAPLTNAGTINFRGNNTVRSGYTTTAAATTRALGDGSTGPATLRLDSATPSTNSGLLEVTSITTANAASIIIGGGGGFTNAAGSTLTLLAGSGGARSIDGSIINAGTITVGADASTGGGTFDTTGTLTIQPGVTLVTDNTFNYQAGTIGGGGTLFSTFRMNIASGLTLTNGPALTLRKTSGEINGPGTLANAAGAVLEPQGNLLIRAPITNAGTLNFRGNITLTGGLTTTAGATTRVLGDGFTGPATLTAQGPAILNNGLFELTSITTANAASLSVSGGSTFTNAVGATFNVLAGSFGARTITSGSFTNAGAFNLTGTDLFFDAAFASFVNSGTVTLGAGATLSLAGTLNNTGTLAGDGALSIVPQGIFTGSLTGSGRVSPGFSPGRLTVNGNVSQGGMVAELNGLTAGTQYDQLVVNGTVTLTGGPLTPSLGFTPAIGNQFRIIDNDGADAVTGTFAGLAQGATVAVGGSTMTISYTGGTGNDVVLTVTNVGGTAPTVTGTSVNAGAVQRSRVTTLAVTFSAQVTFAGTVANAFTLTRNGGGAVNFTATANVVGGVTVVTLNAFTGAETTAGSLNDGNYTLTALASQISAGGANMAANYVFGAVPADKLYRFFGDMNADRRIDIADFGQFSLAYFNPLNFNAALDFNNDGRIDVTDFGQFSARFFTTLP